MTIPHTNDEEALTNVKFSTVWKFGALLAMLMLTSTTGLLFTWGVWVTVTLNSHSEALAVVKSKAGISQNVNVGAADAKGTLVKSGKTWLTTTDVADREGVTERTVLNYIEQDMIQPEPVKDGKAWVIAANYRIVPQNSEDCGREPEP